MKRLPQKIKTAALGDLDDLRLTSDMVDGELCDTAVQVVEGGVICFIAGNDIDNFLNEINSVIEKYRI